MVPGDPQLSFTNDPDWTFDNDIFFTGYDSANVGETYIANAVAVGTGFITYSADTCTVDPTSGVVTFTVSGTCVITATITGSPDYAASSVTLTIAVGSSGGGGNVLANPVNFVGGPNSAVVGESYSVSAYAASGGTITFAVDATSAGVCTLQGTIVTFVTSGTCTIDAGVASSVGYLAGTNSQSINVAAQVIQSITFTSQPPADAVVGGSYVVSATAANGTVTFTLGSSTGCSLSGTTVTFIAAGTCVVTANVTASGAYAAATAFQSFVINPLVVGAPSGVGAVAGDGQAVVSWSPAANASSFTGVVYLVTASPGGATCSSSTANFCVVTGLTDGTTYTFTVAAASSGPLSESESSSSSAGATPSAASVSPPATELTPGAGEVTSDGTTSTSTVSTTSNSATVSSGSSSASITTTLTMGAGSSTAVVLFQGGTASFTGTGFVPGTTVDIYMYSGGTLIGTAVVQPDGSYSVILTIPSSLATGSHTAAVQGFVGSNAKSAFTLGVIVMKAGNLTLQLAHFAPGSAKLSAKMKSQLTKFAAAVVHDGASSMTVTGFSDNSALGRRRTQAVSNFIRQQLNIRHFKKSIPLFIQSLTV